MEYRPHPLSVLAVLGLIILTACYGLPTTTSAKLPMSVPSAIIAGNSVTVLIGPVNALDGTAVGLVMLGTLGPRLYQGHFTAGMASFLIPGEDTAQHGSLSFVAAADDARGQAGSLLLHETYRLHWHSSVAL